MILGKPGAGKTTFLKHLAIQCIGGKFQAERVPVFITLKDFAETNGKPDLLEYLDRLILTHPVETQNFASLKNVVRAGRALILLDGLDEVRDADSDRVLRQITGFSQQFPQNQFVITCRIAAWEYTFDKFTEVEIADFNDKQIADFSGKWFSSKNDPIKAERFLEKLKEDAPIRELATNPLLLTLLCLVFEDFGSFPTNRAELYQTGVDVLLKKWDVKRNIERDPVYKRLSLKRKEDLLSHIAHTTFEAGNYFFKQRQVEYYISQYIQNLPNASTDPEVLELDTAAVLKSIEAQHGLLVERARGIYSFSHLTFHEYFTARKIVTNCNPHTADDPMLQKLVSHLTEKCWREVFLLVIGILYSADTLLRLMKTRIDEMLADNRELQQLISWLDDNTSLSKLPTLTRASLFTLAIEGLPLDLPLDLAESSNSIFHFSSHGYFSLEELSNSPSSVKPYLIILSACETGLESDRRELHQSLQQLKKQLPESGEASETLDKWWQKNGQAWTKQLRAAMIEYRNIGHDWQFSDTQKELLRQYYDANKLLVDCLNSDCYVSREVRQEIEDTLLLPISEIEKRQQSRIR
jgi:predicted NACHT family NTPase